MTWPLLIQTRKEIRALLPWWLGVAATTGIVASLAARHAGFPGFRYEQHVWFVIVHTAGILAVAALSMGHELSHGTLPTLLAHPVDRRRVLSIKLAVLAAMAGALGAVAALLFPSPYLPSGAARLLLIWGPVAAGIGLVPILTILTRRPLGGAVFAAAIPLLILAVSGQFFRTSDGSPVWMIGWYGTLVASACGLLALLYTFPRLEAGGDGGSRSPAGTDAVHQARASGQSVTATRVPRHWLRLLIAKELRLQQLTFAVSGLYVLATIVIAIAQADDPLYVGPTFYAISGLHGVFIALIAGSQASSEERQAGVLGSLMLLPKSATSQWIVKVAVVLGVAVVLAVGLPALLMRILEPSDPFDVESEFVVGVILASIAAIYVSSLCSTSLWSLLACVPAAGAALLTVVAVIDPIIRSMRRGFAATWVAAITPAMQANVQDVGWRALRQDMNRVRTLEECVLMVATTGLALLTLYFASRNHRSLDRGVRRVVRQVLTLVLFTAAATAAHASISRIVWLMR